MTTRRVAELEYRTPNAVTVKRRLDELGAAGERANNRLVRGADAARRQTSLAAQAQDGFSGSLRRTAQSVAVLDGPLGGIAGRFSALATLSGGVGIAVGGVAVATTALVAGLGKAVGAAREFEQATFKIEQLLVTTGNASGRTAAQIEALAQAIGRETLASTQGVRQAAAQLLTFRSIAGETFDETLRLAQDLAAVGFGSIETAAVQLAKALEDPQQGLTSLRRVGVSFTASQREMILAMRDAGDVAGAQAAILSVLREQVGGAGVAEAGGLAGAYDTLGENVGIFLENIGNAGPVQAATAALTVLANAVRELNDELFPTLERKRADLVDALDRAQGQDPATAAGRVRRDEAVAAIRAQIEAIDGLIAKRREEEQAATAASERRQQEIAADIAAERKRAEAKAQAEAAAKAAAAEAKRLAAERERQAQKVADTIARLETENAQLARLAEAYGEGTEAVGRVNDTIAVQNALIAAGVSIKEEDGRAIAGLVVRNRELKRSVDELKRAEEEKQRAAKKAAEEQRRAIEKAAEEQRRVVERSTDDVVRYAGDAFADLFSDTGRGWRGMCDDMVSWARRALARLAAEMVLRPIIQPVIAQVLGGAGIAGSGGGFTGLGTGGGFGVGVTDLVSLGSSLGSGFFTGSAAAGNIGVDIAQFLGFGAETQAVFGNAALNLSSPAGIAGGFIGNLGANLLFGNRGIGADIGGTIGAVAGSFIPIPFVGTAIGSFIGNLIGGLFGGSKKQKIGLETLPTTADGSNPFADHRYTDHAASPFGVVGLNDGTRRVGSAGGQLVDAAAALDRTLARILDEEQIAAVATRLQSRRGEKISRSSYEEHDARRLLLDRIEAILEGLGAGEAITWQGLGLSNEDEGALEKGANLVQELAGTMQFLREPLDAVTRAARQQVGAVVEQANAIRKSVRTFHLSAEEAAQAEVRIREEALKLLKPEDDELSATAQALKQLAATFAELRRNTEALNITAAEVATAETRALADLVAGFDDANRRAILAITDPLALALEDFDRIAAQRLEDVKALGADTVLVERRNMLERQKIVEQFAEETAAAVSNLPRVLEGLTGFAGELQLGSLSAFAPDERYRMASSQFADVASRAAAGEMSALQGFEGAARSFLEISRGRYGSTADYAGDFSRVVSALDRLSAQPQTSWQRLDATISEGNSESARLLRGLIDEVRRLRAEVRQSGTIKPARVA